MALLMQSMVKLNESYFEILGLSFCDANRWTVSSLTSVAAQAFLMREKRPGFFMPTHSTLFNVI